MQSSGVRVWAAPEAGLGQGQRGAHRRRLGLVGRRERELGLGRPGTGHLKAQVGSEGKKGQSHPALPGVCP